MGLSEDSSHGNSQDDWDKVRDLFTSDENWVKIEEKDKKLHINQS